MLLRGLAVSVEPLADSRSADPSDSGSQAPPCAPPSRVHAAPSSASDTADVPDTPAASSDSKARNSGSNKLFLLEPTSISAQAFLASRLPPRSPGLAPGMADAVGGGGGGGGGRAERGTPSVRAMSLRAEAWKTLTPSLLQHLPSIMRNWAQVKTHFVWNDAIMLCGPA